MRNSRRLRHAVLFPLRLLTSFAWRRVTHMLALRGGGADRHPGGHLERCPDQAQATPSVPSVTERKGEAVELAQMSQQPVERTAAPGVANPASPNAPDVPDAPTGERRHARGAWSDRGTPAQAWLFRGETREPPLLGRAIAADAPRWEQPPAYVVRHLVLRLARQHAEFADVPGYGFVVTVPAVWNPMLWN